ncbi:MAG: hypothetical protein ACR5KW_02575 [Wolbachia sp.]
MQKLDIYQKDIKEFSIRLELIKIECDLGKYSKIGINTFKELVKVV